MTGRAKPLRRCGEFAEFYAGADLESICDHIGKLGDDIDREALTAYLRAGNGMAYVMEGVRDVISGKLFREGSGGPSLLTDGVWLWRLDLAHYVETHRVWLPLAFIDHARSNGFEVPTLGEDQLAELAVRERSAHGPDWWATPTHMMGRHSDGPG